VKWLGLRATLLVAVAILLAAPAYADSFTVSASATTLWDSLRITADPGVTITWLGSSNQTSVIQFVNDFSGTGDQTIGNQSTKNWDPLSYSNQSGGRTTSGEATAHSLSAGIAWSDSPPQGRDWMNTDREGNFRVTGSGKVTFAMDYRLAARRSIDAASLPYPKIETNGVLEADLLLYIPYVTSLAYDQHYMFLPDVIGSANDSVSQNGTATVSYQFANGGTYWLRSEAHSVMTVVTPEPASLILLCLGLAGVIVVSPLSGYPRARRRQRASVSTS
jgi:hypothetical protein